VEDELKERINYLSLQSSNILGNANTETHRGGESFNFKQVSQDKNAVNEDDEKLKNQILFLLKKINESG
jgi:hypothetical protein